MTSWYERNKDRAKQNERRWRLANPDKVRAKNIRYNLKHKQKRKEQSIHWRRTNILYAREQERIRKRAFRLEVLAHYGGACSCCGENEPVFLGIDHINGDGKRHRKTISNHIYRWLKANNYPSSFRVLCHNCNMALDFYGYCPHRSPGISYFIRRGTMQSAAARKDAQERK